MLYVLVLCNIARSAIIDLHVLLCNCKLLLRCQNFDLMCRSVGG